MMILWLLWSWIGDDTMDPPIMAHDIPYQRTESDSMIAVIRLDRKWRRSSINGNDGDDEIIRRSPYSDDTINGNGGNDIISWRILGHDIIS